MANERLLLIDDDLYHLQLLQQVFEPEGYQLDLAQNAVEAIAALEKHIPDLILLDLILPDMDGYALLEMIKSNPQWRFIPVIIISSKDGLEDKLRGLRLGVMDYLTKPFEREELKAKVRNLLDFFKLKIHKAEAKKKSGHQRLIDHMKKHGIRVLVPTVCRDAKLGYVYPEAAQILQPEDIGGEIFILESMAKSKFLERVFYDTIHICPKCGHHDLNFREVCAHCEYGDIVQKKVITHLGCGFRGPGEVFRQGNEYRCPQCEDALHRAGEDYEVTLSATHVCMGCKEEFTDPLVRCRCMNCDHQFDVASALVRKIYSYKLISNPNDEDLPDPILRSLPGQTAPLPVVFQDSSLPCLDFEQFCRKLDEEIRRNQHARLPLSLLSLRYETDIFAANPEGANGALLAQALLNQLESILRPSDVLSVRDPSEWLILLPDTPYRIAKILAEKINEAIKKVAVDLTFELTMASYPEDGENGKELLEILRLGLVKF